MVVHVAGAACLIAETARHLEEDAVNGEWLPTWAENRSRSTDNTNMFDGPAAIQKP